MQERGAVAVGILVAFLTLLPLGYLVHVSPRFPGSFPGSLVGIAGATLMLVAFLYVPVKRVPALRTWATRYVTLRTLLAIHVYAGVFGPVLGLLHAAHKFRSPLAVSLTGTMVVLVLTGYIGRYLLLRIATAVQGQRATLATLTTAFNEASAGTEADPHMTEARGWLTHLLFRVSSTPGADGSASRARHVVQLADAMADVESAVRTEEVMRVLFGKWQPLHTLVAILVAGLLALHIWSGFYYGLRWLQ